MTTIDEAKAIVEARIREFNSADLDCVIQHDSTIETNDYWVIFYNSSEFVKTGDYSQSLVGNAPYIVDKYEGGIYETGAVYDIDYYMKQFEERILPEIIHKNQR